MVTIIAGGQNFARFCVRVAPFLWAVVLCFFGVRANAASQLGTPAIAADFSFYNNEIYIRLTADPDPHIWYYKVYRKRSGTSGPFEQIDTVGGAGLSYYSPVPLFGWSYTYKVKAFPYDTVTYAASNDSNESSALTPPPDPAGFDLSLSRNNAANLSVHLKWNEAYPEVDGYHLFKSTDGTNWTEIATPTADTLTYDDPSIVPNTIYYYAIFSYNALSWSYNALQRSIEVPQQPIYFQLLSTTDLHAAIYDPAHGVNPDTRTEVGFGETVHLHITYPYDLDGSHRDSLKTPVWSLSDDSSAKILNISQDGLSCQVRFAAGWDSTSVGVTATIDDLALYGDDPPVSNTISFSVKAPSNIIAIYGQKSVDGKDFPILLSPFDGFTQNAQGESISSRRLFLLQVQPTTVNFENLSTRENLYHEAFSWPNLTYPPEDNHGPRPVPATIFNGNFMQDDVGSEVARARIALSRGGEFVGANHTFHAPIEWQMDNGFWHPPFITNVQPRIYSASGVTTLGENGQSAPPDGPWIE